MPTSHNGRTSAAPPRPAAEPPRHPDDGAGGGTGAASGAIVTVTGWPETRVHAGDAMTLVHRPEGSVAVAEINRVLNIDRQDLEGITRVLTSPELPGAWRTVLQRRLDGRIEDDKEPRGAD